jgi:hypothetical protein
MIESEYLAKYNLDRTAEIYIGQASFHGRAR